MFEHLLRALCLSCLLMPLALSAQPPVPSLDADTWSRPRSAESLIALAPLRETVAALQASADRRLQIRHPQDEQGELWASELRDWLVALGIPSARIELRADPGVIERVDLLVQP